MKPKLFDLPHIDDQQREFPFSSFTTVTGTSCSTIHECEWSQRRGKAVYLHMTLSKHCHRVHLSKVKLKVCFSVLQQHDGAMDRSVCVLEGLVIWASVNTLLCPHPQHAYVGGGVFVPPPTHADLLLEASLQWPSSHMRCVWVYKCIKHWCDCVSLWWSLVPSSFYYGSLTKGSLVLFFCFCFCFFPPPPLLSTLNLLTSVECMAVHSKFL